MALRLRRGTDLERQSVIFAEGELVYTTDTKALYVGDGQTLGGILISGDINESPDTLTRDLDLNGYNITGSGDIEISGIVTATRFVGDGSGLTNLNTLDVTEGGFYSINIVGLDSTVIVNRETNTFFGNFIGDLTGTLQGTVLGDDSSIIVNSATNEFFGKFVGDGSELTNLPVPAIAEGDSYKINIIGIDSSTIIDVNTNTITGTLQGVLNGTGESTITSDAPETTALTLNTPVSGSSGQKMIFKGFAGTLANPIEPADFSRAGIAFDFFDGSNFRNNSQVYAYYRSSGAGYLALSASDVNQTFFETAIELDGEAKNIILTGSVSCSNNFLLGRLSTVERDALTPSNGSIIYNTTANRFQGYQNSAWINLDDGSPA